MKILIIDDCDLDRERMQRLLKRESASTYAIQEGVSGQECLELVSKTKFDCILLDYHLPDMNALDILQSEEKACLEEAAVILLTGASDDKIDRRAEELGASDYLIKDQLNGPLLERSIRYAVNIKSTINELRHANRVKDDFMAAMSHEMRTPLNAIINFAGHLKMGVYGKIEDQQAQITDRIQRAGNHLSTIVEGVLSVMSFKRDALELEVKNVNLSEEIQLVAELTQGTAHEKGLDLIVQIPDGIYLEGDSCRIRQILLNIIGNAIKFTDVGSIQVSCQLADGECFISVKDTGIGIAADKITHVLEPFVQIEGSLSRRYGGLGLGLAISKKLVELHGGRLLLESIESKGTTVTICLPCTLPK